MILRPIIIATVSKGTDNGIRLLDIDTYKTMDVTLSSIKKNINSGMEIYGINDVYINDRIPKVLSDGAVRNISNVVAIEELPHGMYRVSNFDGATFVKELDNTVILYDKIPKGKEFRVYENKDSLVRRQKIIKPVYELNNEGMAKVRDGLDKERYDCELILPDGVLGILDYGFSGCNIRSLVIPESCEYIGRNAFSGCKKLDKVKILGKVSVIRNSAFENCISLSNVELSSYVKEIRASAFMGCNKLRQIKFKGKGRLPSTEYSSMGPSCIIVRG